MKNIKTGDLLVFKEPPRGFKAILISKLIRTFTSSIFTHVGIAVVENGEVYVVEAVIPKIRKVKLKSLKEDCFHIEMNLEDKIKDYDLKWLYSKIDKEYSFFQATMSLFKIRFRDDKWFCTELADEFYRKKLGVTYYMKSLEPGEFVVSILTIKNTRLKLILAKEFNNDNLKIT